MKKYINIAFIYGILGICGGVFYREFTKFMDFVDMRTQLAFLHVHLFVFGMIMFLLVAVFEKLLNIRIRQHILFLLLQCLCGKPTPHWLKELQAMVRGSSC